MARRLKNFPTDDVPSTRRYPWSDWTDGNPWEIRRGEDHDEAQSAMELLHEDTLSIYERARHEVTIPRSDGKRQRYAAVRYRQQIERGWENNELVSTIARIIRRPTLGFGHLKNAGRPDLMLETLVLDTGKPYHRFFTTETIETARRRMQGYGYPTDG